MTQSDSGIGPIQKQKLRSDIGNKELTNGMDLFNPILCSTVFIKHWSYPTVPHYFFFTLKYLILICQTDQQQMLVLHNKENPEEHLITHQAVVKRAAHYFTKLYPSNVSPQHEGIFKGAVRTI